MDKKIKTIFIGTPDFSVPTLATLVKDEYFEIITAITQPDKKAGRKQELCSPPVKQYAREQDIPVLQPEKIKDISSQIRQLSPDLIIVIAYAQIIPKSILEIPQYGAINVHASLLPKYRGASCIQSAILHGDEQTGITIMKMDEGLDTGPILTQKIIGIDDSDTAESLFVELAELGAKMLAPAVKDYINGAIMPLPQDNNKPSYAGILKKKDGRIDWSKPASEIERFVRAMHSWPGAFSQFNGGTIKIIKTGKADFLNKDLLPGTLFTNNGNLMVKCGQDSLAIENLQLPGKKIMNGQEFLNGYSKFLLHTLN